MAQRTPKEQSRLEELAAALPSTREAAEGEDLDRRARGVLAIVVERTTTVGTSAGSAFSDPELCPNCGIVASVKTSPYCSDCCRERAAFVRQMRDGLAKGTIFDEHRQAMKGEGMWRLLGGGLPRRLSLVPDKARERVFKRAEGKCELCGAPATTIDNTGSG
jgi:hypothetical protein